MWTERWTPGFFAAKYFPTFSGASSSTLDFVAGKIFLSTSSVLNSIASAKKCTPSVDQSQLFIWNIFWVIFAFLCIICSFLRNSWWFHFYPKFYGWREAIYCYFSLLCPLWQFRYWFRTSLSCFSLLLKEFHRYLRLNLIYRNFSE